MNEKGEIRIKEEKSRLPGDVRGSKTSLLKLPINTFSGGGGGAANWCPRIHSPKISISIIIRVEQQPRLWREEIRAFLLRNVDVKKITEGLPCRLLVN